MKSVVQIKNEMTAGRAPPYAYVINVEYEHGAVDGDDGVLLTNEVFAYSDFIGAASSILREDIAVLSLMKGELFRLVGDGLRARMLTEFIERESLTRDADFFMQKFMRNDILLGGHAHISDVSITYHQPEEKPFSLSVTVNGLPL